jgi:hypothetical protein
MQMQKRSSLLDHALRFSAFSLIGVVQKSLNA